uniref:Putative salivary mucin n=1 Tax=Culex tarsalis TaxID=7177 RepID=A0A1Q3FDM3_CULTA
MTSLRFLVALVVALLTPETTLAFGWNWLLGFATTTSSSSTSSSSSSTSSGSSNTASNYDFSIGNRRNTTAGANDYGTMISNLSINLARFNGTAIEGNAGVTLLDDAVLSVAEAYRNESTRAIAERLAWFNDQIADANRSANGVHHLHIRDLVEDFANDTRTGVHGLSNATRDCLDKSVEVEDVIRSVEERSTSGCLRAKIQRMLELRAEANSNLTEFLESQQDVEDRLEICVDLQDDFNDDMSDFYKVACVSSILFDVQTETARLELTVEGLTAEAGVALRRLRAGLLECVADVANYAFDASLKLRHWINVCRAAH